VQISELTQNLLNNDVEVMTCAHKLGDDFFLKNIDGDLKLK